MRSLHIAALVTVTVASGAVAIARADAPSDPDATRPYDLSGQPDQGVRPTAVGLPRVFGSGSIGAGEITSGLMSYHDSGRYEHDLETVDQSAQDYVRERLAAAGTPAKKTCTSKYVVAGKRDKKGRKLYLRRRSCPITKPPSLGKPAIVLDIDETSLSNYGPLAAAGFRAAALALPAATGDDPAIAPTLSLYRYAKANGVAVFFVTGRPSVVESSTESNLRKVGYANWDGLQFKPSGMTTVAYKSGARAAIEAKGYTILANVGDQESDLDGGHAEQAFKLPNPFYYISD